MDLNEKRNRRRKPAAEVRRECALLCLSLFFHRYLRIIYGNEDLDLVSITLLNEIAQHNLEPFVRGGRVAFPGDADEMRLMQGCNAFSLSQATGVPRETTRRKIKQLVELGWVEQHNRKGLFVTERWMDRLAHEDISKLLADFKETADRIRELTAH
jgi:hypothetical protein